MVKRPKYVEWQSFNKSIGKKKKLRGFGPLANYADRATAACWRSSANFADRGCCVVSATYSPGH
jgi:hypothetical protein